MHETEPRPAEVTRDNPDVGHETTDTSFRGTVAFAAGLIVFLVMAHVVIWFMFRFWQQMFAARQPVVSPLAEEDRGQLPRAPVLEGFEKPARVAERRTESVQPALSADEAMKLLDGKIQIRSPDEARRLRRVDRPWDSTSGRIMEERR